MRADEIEATLKINIPKMFEDTETTKYTKNEEGCVVGIMGIPEKRENITVLFGSSGIGKSLKFAQTIASLKIAGYNVKIAEDIEKAPKKMLGLDYDLLAIDEISRLSTLAESYEQSKIRIQDKFLSYDPIKEHHVGKGDPNGLRQQFNRNGKKFR